jgi:hypothetical protein
MNKKIELLDFLKLLDPTFLLRVKELLDLVKIDDLGDIIRVTIDIKKQSQCMITSSIDKLPKVWRLNEKKQLVRDVSVVDGDVIWMWMDGCCVSGKYSSLGHYEEGCGYEGGDIITVIITEDGLGKDLYVDFECCYISKEAAEAAKKTGDINDE